MKKIVIIGMLLLYGSAAIGATVHIHYCMSKFTGISFFEKKNAACNTCGMPKDKAHGCCHDECKQLQLAADQLLTSVGYEVPGFSTAAAVPGFIVLPARVMPLTLTIKGISHAPPGAIKRKLYIQNNVWLI